MALISLLFVLAAQAHIPNDPMVGPVTRCEALLNDLTTHEGQMAERILLDALLYSIPDSRVRFESKLKHESWAAFGFPPTGPSLKDRQAMRFTAADYEVTLTSTAGERHEIFKASIDPKRIRHWYALGRHGGEGQDHLVTIASEVGVVLGVTPRGARRYFSARYVRGGRIVMTFGLDVPCAELKNYSSVAAAHIYVHSTVPDVGLAKFCRVPVIVVNTRLRAAD